MGAQDEAPKVSFARLPEGKAEGEEKRMQTMEDIRCDDHLWSLEGDEEKSDFSQPRICLGRHAQV